MDRAGWEAAAPSVLTESFLVALRAVVGRHIEHKEPRVRSCVVDLLEWLSRKEGTSLYVMFRDQIVESILTNFVRTGESDDEEDEAGDGAGVGVGAAASDSKSETTASVSSSRSRKPRIAHDTVGWKALESSIKAIRAVVVGCGNSFLSEGHLTEQLREDIIPRATCHINRFVREAVFFLCDAIINAATLEDLTSLGYDVRLSELLAKGLCDNWSQVCGCVAV